MNLDLCSSVRRLAPGQANEARASTLSPTPGRYDEIKSGAASDRYRRVDELSTQAAITKQLLRMFIFEPARMN